MPAPVNSSSDVAAGPRPVLAIVAAAVLFGTTGTARHLGPDEAGVWAVGALRLLVGSVLLGAIAAVTEGWRRARVRDEWRGYLLGGVGVVVFQSGFFIATDRTGVAVGTVVTIGTGPVVAGLLAAATSRHGVTRSWVVATAVTVVGATVLVLAVAGRLEVDALGVLAAITAGTAYAGYAATVKHRIDRGAGPTAALAATFAAGAVVLAPVLVVEPVAWAATAGGIALVGHLAIATLAVAYTLYGWGLARLPVPTVVTLTLAEPLTAALLATVVVGEPIGPGGWVGVLLVVVGLALTGRTGSVEAEPSALPVT